MKLFLPKFSDSLLALNHLFKDSNIIFTSFLNSSRLELVNITLVSFTNNIDLDFPLRVFDNSFMWRRRSEGPILILEEHRVL
jgi:hypothetical protein